MRQIADTVFRQDVARYLDEAVSGHAPMVVTRQGSAENVVVMSQSEFDGWQETVHLLSSPANAERLLRSIAQVRAGLATERNLIEPAAEA